MEDPTAIDIERYLLEQSGWITTDRLCDHFEISDRRLRHLGAGFLVSRPGGGYIHRDYATRAELEAYCGPKLAHSRTERLNIFQLRRNYNPRPRPDTGIATVQPSLL